MDEGAEQPCQKCEKLQDRIDKLNEEFAVVESRMNTYRELLEGIAWDIKGTLR